MWWYRGSWLNQQDQMPMIAPSLLSIACLMSTRTVLWMNAWQSIRWLRRKVKALWLQWRNSLRKKWQSTRYGSKWNTEQIRLHFVCAHLSNIGTLYAPQKYIVGMLTNFGSMSLDRIHNTLKVMAQKMVGRHSPYLIYWFFFMFHILISFHFFFLILQMFCIAEPSYDKSLQQLQSFLSGLVADEKLETRDGLYLLKR